MSECQCCGQPMEQPDDEPQIIKRGKLKQDMYGFKNDREFLDRLEVFFLETHKTVTKMMNATQRRFYVVAKQGAEFYCLQFNDGDRLWYDDEGLGIEDMDDKWAKKNLEIYDA